MSPGTSSSAGIMRTLAGCGLGRVEAFPEDGAYRTIDTAGSEEMRTHLRR
jgi:hypothetical protein